MLFSKPRTAVAIRHVAFEDLGAFGPTLEEAGYKVRYLEAGVDDLKLDPIGPDLVIILGGPIGAYEEDKYPFLKDEIESIRQRIAAQQATIGICLGAQLIAKALGAKVYPGKQKEIGWSQLTLSEAGMQSPIRHLADVNVLHWHGDTFDLPQGATHLASTPITQNQAFAIGNHVLAFQCHPEADEARFERWLIGHANEIATAGLSVQTLREDTKRHAAKTGQAGHKCLLEWIAALDAVN
jgi:GMP synthase (glutamine-hydrolysing)